MSEKKDEIKMVDWNKVPLETIARLLEDKYKILSSGEAKCICELIAFYDKNKGGFTLKQLWVTAQKYNQEDFVKIVTEIKNV